MRLIVGLGNPGREYRETRHNVGFMVVDEIARRHGLSLALAPSQVPDALVAKRFGAEPVLVAKPLTFMNRSGAPQDRAPVISRRPRACRCRRCRTGCALGRSARR